jgi:hypothetical protein
VIYWFRARDEGGFVVLRRYNLFFLFSSFGSLHPTLRPSHEDMGSNFILEVIDKTLLEKGIIHALCSKSQELKGSYKVFHCSYLFYLYQMAQMVGVNVKAFINLYHKLCPSNIPLT